MASSFNGVAVVVLADPSVPRALQADNAYTHIPGGNTTYVDLGGATLREVTYRLYFPSIAAFLSFEAQLGQVGTLITTDGTFVAVLDNMRRVIHGASSAGECVAECLFKVL